MFLMLYNQGKKIVLYRLIVLNVISTNYRGTTTMNIEYQFTNSSEEYI